MNTAHAVSVPLPFMLVSDMGYIYINRRGGPKKSHRRPEHKAVNTTLNKAEQEQLGLIVRGCRD